MNYAVSGATTTYDTTWAASTVVTIDAPDQMLRAPCQEGESVATGITTSEEHERQHVGE